MGMVPTYDVRSTASRYSSCSSPFLFRLFFFFFFFSKVVFSFSLAALGEPFTRRMGGGKSRNPGEIKKTTAESRAWGKKRVVFHR